MTEKKGYLSAREAAARLGISRATLYSYVSRGLIRSEERDGPTRHKHYNAADVERLQQRQRGRRQPESAAQQSLRYGMPVLPSAITLIDSGRLYYRGHDALTLAQQRSFEAVVALLWQGEVTWPHQSGTVSQAATEPATLEGMQRALTRAAEGDLAAYRLAPEQVRQCGARILQRMTQTASGHAMESSIAEALQRAWSPQRPAAVAALSAALVLCADHELNVSAFTARCIASAGATPYHVVIGGLAALSGFRHGNQSELVATFWRRATEVGAEAAIGDYLRRNERPPGFDHRLYPSGDPRGRLLLSLAASLADEQCATRQREIIDGVQRLCDGLPNIDVGLVALTHALGLPQNAPLLLFALGRTAGWLAHALEEYERGTLIRPRAQYVGPPPLTQSN